MNFEEIEIALRENGEYDGETDSYELPIRKDIEINGKIYPSVNFVGFNENGIEMYNCFPMDLNDIESFEVLGEF